MQRRLPPQTFPSETTKEQMGFYKNVRDPLGSRGVLGEPRGVSRNEHMARKVMKNIWPVARSAIIDS